MGFFKTDPVNVEVQGRELKCLVCGNDSFRRNEAQLNTAVATFFRLDWTNSTGLCYVCSKCGYIHWFLPG
jgi:predicted nucleic-acid-binding Zn-ribbon protein